MKHDPKPEAAVVALVAVAEADLAAAAVEVMAVVVAVVEEAAIVVVGAVAVVDIKSRSTKKTQALPASQIADEPHHFGGVFRFCWRKWRVSRRYPTMASSCASR